MKILYPNQLLEAVGIVKRGGIAIFPTDTVYGLGANPFDVLACKKIFDTKVRKTSKPLVIMLCDTKKLNQFVDVIPKKGEELIQKFWPGALTLIFKKKAIINDVVTSHFATVGVRVPDNKIAIEFIRLCGGALAVTSANISGKSAAVSVATIDPLLKKNVDVIIDGGVCKNTPSTIADLSNGELRILRNGTIKL